MTNIEILNLSHYISRHLRLQGIYTVEMLATLGEQELALVPGLGLKAIEEVKLKLADYLADHPLPDSLPAYIRVLGLNKRIYNALHRARVDTVEQLASMSDEEILAVRNIGVNSLEKIKEKLSAYLQENPLLNQDQWSSQGSYQTENLEEVLAKVPCSRPIEHLTLSTRSYNALKWAGIEFVEHICLMSDRELLEIDNLGEKSLQDIRTAINKYLKKHPLSDEFITSVEQFRSKPKEQPCFPDMSLENVLTKIPFPKPIDRLSLSVRSYNALKRAGVESIEHILLMSDQEILRVENIGRNALQEIRNTLSRYLKKHPLPDEFITLAKCFQSMTGKQLPLPTMLLEEVLTTISSPKPIEHLSLPIRPYNALKLAGIEYVEHIWLMSDQELLEIRNIGQKSLQEIQNALSQYTEKHPLPDEFIALAEQFRSRTDKLHLSPTELEEVIEVFTPLFDLESLERIPSLLLDKIPIARLALPYHLQHELFSHDIESVGELMRQTSNVFRQPELLQDRLKRYLDWILEQDEGVWANEIAERGISIFHEEEIKGGSLDELIADWFADLDDRERKIIYARYSLTGGKKQTLAELGEQIGVTRERVRQLQGRAENRLKRAYNWVKIESLMVLFKHLLDETGGIINKRQIRRGIRQMLSTGDLDPAGVANLVFKLDENVQYLSQINAWGDKDLPLNTVQGIQEQFVNLLEEEKTPLPVQEIITKLKNTPWYKNQPEELKDNFLEICLHAHPQIRIQDGTCSLKKRGWQRVACMITALRQIGEPAHYTVIAEHANSLLPPRLRRSTHSTHADMGRYEDIFVRVGHGIFGLAEWGLEDDGSLANAAHRVLTEAGKPLHHDIITDKVLETWKVRPGSVLAAMEMDERFVNIGSGVYWLSDQEMVEATVDFGDLFGTQLAQAQKEMDRWGNEGQYDTHEVDTLRSLGTDIFKE